MHTESTILCVIQQDINHQVHNLGSDFPNEPLTRTECYYSMPLFPECIYGLQVVQSHFFL